MSIGRVIVPVKEPIRDQYVFIMEKSQSFYTFYLLIYYFGDSASYLLEMAVLISLDGILTQTRMGVGWVALPSTGPMRDQYICFMEKTRSFYKFLFILNIPVEPPRRSVRVAERLALPTSDHGVAGSNPAGGAILSEPKRRFMAQILWCSPSIVPIWLKYCWKGRKTPNSSIIHQPPRSTVVVLG